LKLFNYFSNKLLVLLIKLNSLGVAKRDVERFRTAVETIKLIVTKLVDEIATESFVLSSSHNVFICLYQLLNNMQDVMETYLKHLHQYEMALENPDKMPETEPNIYLTEKNGLRTSIHVFQHLWRLFGEKPIVYWKLVKDQEMGQILNQELGFSVISLASRLHLLDTITSQHILNLFVTMMSTDGCISRYLVEYFQRQVFLKYLHVAWAMISNQVSSIYLFILNSILNFIINYLFKKKGSR
jgi:hypothetical protein